MMNLKADKHKDEKVKPWKISWYTLDCIRRASDNITWEKFKSWNHDLCSYISVF